MALTLSVTYRIFRIVSSISKETTGFQRSKGDRRGVPDGRHRIVGITSEIVLPLRLAPESARDIVGIAVALSEKESGMCAGFL